MASKGNNKQATKKTETGIYNAKVATVAIGNTDDPISILVNCNCTFNILLDHIRQQLLVKLNQKIKSINEQLTNNSTQAAATTTTTAATATADDKEKTPDENQEALSNYLKVLKDIQQKLTPDDVILEVFDDAGVPLGVAQYMTANANESGFVSKVTYTIGVVPPDGSQPTPLLFKSPEANDSKGKKK